MIVGAVYDRALFLESTKYARSQTAPTRDWLLIRQAPKRVRANKVPIWIRVRFDHVCDDVASQAATHGQFRKICLFRANYYGYEAVSRILRVLIGHEGSHLDRRGDGFRAASRVSPSVL